jgi:hypothetical protein
VLGRVVDATGDGVISGLGEDGYGSVSMQRVRQLDLRVPVQLRTAER